MGKVAAIILAAGLSRRFGTDPDDSKVLAMLDGIPLIRHVAEAASASQARPICVVTGRADPKVQVALAGLDLRCIHNPKPEAGLSQSLALGLDYLATDISGALILLADMPYISAPLIDRLIAAFETAPAETFAVVPIHAGRRGNPVLLGKGIFAAVKAIEGDRGARGIIDAMDHGIVEISIDDRSIEIDIDTPDMLDHLRAESKGA
ncbi:NTP transferase domain-containing protein [Methylovirgula sp. HY1]|uniref:nucleotidyltransferase family protein n=1 Tax=Methylovirgula sp. HY1 TaxID=2822761 RepID=UPI001C5B56D9|nr:nucleotidyltransferase family protein [Methylovirgula sp. HY1]QXX76238.1 Nicotine blue oxidoreductase [Methylovirgula sp. HY1]